MEHSTASKPKVCPRNAAIVASEKVSLSNLFLGSWKVLDVVKFYPRKPGYVQTFPYPRGGRHVSRCTYIHVHMQCVHKGCGCELTVNDIHRLTTKYRRHNNCTAILLTNHVLLGSLTLSNKKWAGTLVCTNVKAARRL